MARPADRHDQIRQRVEGIETNTLRIEHRRCDVLDTMEQQQHAKNGDAAAEISLCDVMNVMGSKTQKHTCVLNSAVQTLHTVSCYPRFASSNVDRLEHDSAVARVTRAQAAIRRLRTRPRRQQT